MLYEHFANGTKGTVTGAQVGAEIETSFVDERGAPISEETAWRILGLEEGRPEGVIQKLELGRQNIELAVAPQASAERLLDRVFEGLGWLYRGAARFGAGPVFAPQFEWPHSLLMSSTDHRDKLWLELDGDAALEHLCRISSVQFTVDVNPAEAAEVLNRLSADGLHRLDYPNDAAWRLYITESAAGYRADRYAGPSGFEDLRDYAHQLSRHEVVMHNGQLVRPAPESVGDLDADLYLRSVWWHYRLRRYGETLAVEIRPFARRDDAKIPWYLQQVSDTIGL